MATVKISADPSKLFWAQTTTLDGEPYLLTFRYNTREAAYYLTIRVFGRLGDLRAGRQARRGHCAAPRLRDPAGELFVTASADDSPPRLGDIGDGLRCCSLYYIEQADIAPFETHRNPGPL